MLLADDRLPTTLQRDNPTVATAACRARSTSAKAFGSGILQRLALREKTRLQAQFLGEVARLSFAHHLTLCGGAALHGVYLHQRWSKDLDFEAPYLVAVRFQETLRRSGLPLEPMDNGEAFIFSLPSPVFPDISIGVDIFARREAIAPAEERPFRTPGGESLPVRVQPLHQILAVKLGCLYACHRACDWVDLWMGLTSAPEAVHPMRELLEHPRWSCGIYTAPRPFSADAALQRLDALQPAWEEELTGVFFPIPEFDAVRRDMERWLPLFTTRFS